MPRLNKAVIGGYKDDKLVAVATFGWGTRPFHTIKKIFPSLSTPDYFELGKLCLSDELPRNSESFFISKAINWLKENRPTVKLLYSWADGIIGKPGYVYQASNFYYGGYIWTEMYLSPEGNRVHVRSVQGDPRLPKVKGSNLHSRSFENIAALGYKKYWGLQFRYVYPLCSKKEWKRLQAESPLKWERGNYPKLADCRWKVQVNKGKKEPCILPPGITTKYVPRTFETDIEN